MARFRKQSLILAVLLGVAAVAAGCAGPGDATSTTSVEVDSKDLVQPRAAAAKDAAEPAEAPAAEIAAAAEPARPSDLTPGDNAKFGDWGVICPEAPKEGEAGLGCRLIQSAVLNVEGKDGEEARSHRVMLTAIGFVEGEEQPVLTAMVPLGVLIAPGLVLDVDGYDSLRLTLQRCDGNGCVAVLPMKEHLVDAFRQGKEASITFFNVAGKANPVRVSLDGFADGLQKVAEQRAQG